MSSPQVDLQQEDTSRAVMSIEPTASIEGKQPTDECSDITSSVDVALPIRQNPEHVAELNRRAEEIEPAISDHTLASNLHIAQLNNHHDNIHQIERRVDVLNARLEKLAAETHNTHVERENLIRGLEKFEQMAKSVQVVVIEDEERMEEFKAYLEGRGECPIVMTRAAEDENGDGQDAMEE